jgi:hypothetical protein
MIARMVLNDVMLYLPLRCHFVLMILNASKELFENKSEHSGSGGISRR